MPDSKLSEGFVILDKENLPQNLVKEINYYNSMIENFEQSEFESNAIIASEEKILKFFLEHPGIYPLKVVYGNVSMVNLLQEKKVNHSDIINKLKEIESTFGKEY